MTAALRMNSISVGLLIHPVHQVVAILEGGVRQAALDGLLALGGEIVGVGLGGNDFLVQAAGLQDIRHVLIGVLEGIVHIVVGVGIDVVLIQIGGETGGVAVLAAAEPDGLVQVQGYDHALMHIEGPAVKAGEIVHVGGVRDDQHVNAVLLHALAGLFHSLQILFHGENQILHLTRSS